MKTTEAIGKIPRPESIIAMAQEDLEEMIRPCGFFHSKAGAIKALAAWWMEHRYPECISDSELRSSLLAIRGVGEETADVILLYAFRRPVFIVDAYTQRLLSRLGYQFRSDDGIRRYISSGLSADALDYGRFHWLVLQHCITVCRKKPECSSCVLLGVCHHGREVLPK